MKQEGGAQLPSAPECSASLHRLHRRVAVGGAGERLPVLAGVPVRLDGRVHVVSWVRSGRSRLQKRCHCCHFLETRAGQSMDGGDGCSAGVRVPHPHPNPNHPGPGPPTVTAQSFRPAKNQTKVTWIKPPPILPRATSRQVEASNRLLEVFSPLCLCMTVTTFHTGFSSTTLSASELHATPATRLRGRSDLWPD